MIRWPEEDRRREDKVSNLNKNLDLPEGFDFGGTTQTLFDSEGQMEVIFHQEHSLHKSCKMFLLSRFCVIIQITTSQVPGWTDEDLAIAFYLGRQQRKTDDLHLLMTI